LREEIKYFLKKREEKEALFILFKDRINMKKKEEDFMKYLAEADDDPIFRFSDEFELVQVLGEGAFGLVIAAREKYTGITSALKVSFNIRQACAKMHRKRKRERERGEGDLGFPNLFVI
jgi:hypothetical protein